MEGCSMNAWVFIFIAAMHEAIAECPGITMGPSNTAGIVGNEASMFARACQNKTRPEVFVWSMEQSGDEVRIWQSDHPEIYQREGYRVNYPDDMSAEGEYELLMPTVSLNMGGQYMAEFLNGLSPPKTKAVFVAVEPMTNANTCPKEGQSKNDGDEITMVCEVTFQGDPTSNFEPKLTWFEVTSTDTVFSGNATSAGKARSQATVTASADIHMKKYTCALQFDNTDFTDSCTTYYNISHKVSEIEFYPDPDREENGILSVHVGDIINCTANGNPPPKYRWMCPENYLVDGPELIIGKRFVRNEGETKTVECTCRAENRINGVTVGMDKNVEFVAYEHAGEENPIVQGAAGWKIAVGIIVPLIVIGIIVAVVLYWTKCKYRDEKEQAHLPVPTSEPEEDVPPPGAPPMKASFQPTFLVTAPTPDKPWNPHKKPVPLPRPTKSTIEDKPIQDSVV